VPHDASDAADAADEADSGEAPECGAGLTSCNGVACVDLTSNPNNCGACNHVCTGSASIVGCCDAACYCGACGVVCEAGTSCIMNVCK
jgi:hypothetical protein